MLTSTSLKSLKFSVQLNFMHSVWKQTIDYCTTTQCHPPPPPTQAHRYLINSDTFDPTRKLKVTFEWFCTICQFLQLIWSGLPNQ